MISFNPCLKSDDNQLLTNTVKEMLSESCWYGQASEENLSCIGANLDSIKKIDDTTIRRFICIIAGRTSLSANDLLDKAKELSVNPEDIFEAAAFMNRADMIEELNQRVNLDSMITGTMTLVKAFRTARSFGHLATLEKLTQLFPIDNYLVRDLIYSAAVEGQIDVLNWVEIKLCTETIMEFKSDNVTNDKNYFNNKMVEKLILAHNFELFTKVAAHGHVEVLSWIAKQVAEYVQDMIEVVETTGQLSAMLSISGRPDARSTFYKQWFDINSYAGFRSAVYHGHSNVLDWFRERTESHSRQTMIEACFREFVQATEHERFDSIKWLKQFEPVLYQKLLTQEKDSLLSVKNIAILCPELNSETALLSPSPDIQIIPNEKRISTDKISIAHSFISNKPIKGENSPILNIEKESKKSSLKNKCVLM